MFALLQVWWSDVCVGTTSSSVVDSFSESEPLDISSASTSPVGNCQQSCLALKDSVKLERLDRSK